MKQSEPTGVVPNINQLRAKDLMTRQAITVSPEDSVNVALSLMEENRLTALPVVDNRDHVIGMLSSADLGRLLSQVDFSLGDLASLNAAARDWMVTKIAAVCKDQVVSQFMTEGVATIGEQTPLEIVSSEFLRNRVHHLPVVDERKRILGIVSTMDLVSAVAEFCRDVSRQSGQS